MCTHVPTSTAPALAVLGWFWYPVRLSCLHLDQRRYFWVNIQAGLAAWGELCLHEGNSFWMQGNPKASCNEAETRFGLLISRSEFDDGSCWFGLGRGLFSVRLVWVLFVCFLFVLFSKTYFTSKM